MIFDPNSVYDGFASLETGVDGGRLSNLLAKNQCQEAVNVVFREGAPDNRLPLRDVEMDFTNPNTEYYPDGRFRTFNGSVGASRNAYQRGRFQEASYFGLHEGTEYMMASIGGRLWRITPGNGQSCELLEIHLDRRNRSTIPIGYHLQAGVFHITQDGEGSPIIFNGVNARRAVPGEIFTGRMMAYGQGRIVQIANNGDIYFGDIRDGKGNGDADLLGFTETFYLNEGFPTALPGGMGRPTAVQFIPAQDTATGVGECLVFGQHGIESLFLAIPRELWKESQFQRTALLEVGNASHRSVAVVNQDIFFRDPVAGWRSYRQARAQVNEWSQIPLSTNIRKWIDAETHGSSELLDFTSAISFQNRLIATVSPYPNQGRLYHNGLVSLDFDILSSFGKTSSPAWDGQWTDRTKDPKIGLRVTRLVEGIFRGRQRAFVFYIDPYDRLNKIREILPTPIGGDSAGPIRSHLITRSMDFDKPVDEKKLYGGDLWLDKVTEETQFTVSYKPDQFPTFSPWHSFNVEPVGTPGEVTPGMVPTIKEGFNPRRSLPKPPDIGDPLNTKRIMRRFYDVQAKIQWTGRARIRKFRARSQIEVENAKATIP